MSWGIAASLPLAVLAAPSQARADEPAAQDIAQARELGGQAAQAHEAGNYAEAEKLWAAASKLYPLAPTLTLGLARSQAKLGKVVAAQESYNKIIREWGTNPSPPPAFKDALEAAKAEVGAVSARVASVVISVEGPQSAKVTIDGQPVPPAALGLKRPVDPGQHTVKASAEGFKPAETVFSVNDGASAEAKLKLERDESAVAAAPTPATGPADPVTPPPAEVGGDAGKGGSSNKTLALAAFGVGAAGLVVGSITGLMAMGKHSDLEKSCPNGTCPPGEQDNVDSYNTLGTVSTVGFVVAGVGAAAGAVLWFTAPKTTGSAAGARYATERTKPTVVPYLGLGAAGVTGRF